MPVDPRVTTCDPRRSGYTNFQAVIPTPPLALSSRPWGLVLIIVPFAAFATFAVRLLFSFAASASFAVKLFRHPYLVTHFAKWLDAPRPLL